MKKRILIVEDHQETAVWLKDVLESCGHEISCAYNGLEGYQKAKESVPDLILLDIMMPIMDGHVMNRHLKADTETENIPVVVVSATPPPVSSKNKAGIEGYLIKPFALKDLIEKVEDLFSAVNSGAERP